MTIDVYEKLAKHLDKLPAGYPCTESGVEIHILQQLFTPEDGELALHLTLISEEPRVIAYRAGISKSTCASSSTSTYGRKCLNYAQFQWERAFV